MNIIYNSISYSQCKYIINQIQFKLSISMDFDHHLNQFMPRFSAKVADPSSEKPSNAIRLMCFSDTHGKHNDIPQSSIVKSDIAIFCGDLTLWGNPKDAESFKEFLTKLPVDERIVISGNLDLLFDTQHIDRFNDLAKQKDVNEKLNGAKEKFLNNKNFHFLESQYVELKGIKFFGSPNTPVFFDLAFNSKPEELKNIWENVNADTDVLICHGPPANTLDCTSTDFHAGCQSYRAAIERVKPAAALFGHIHEAHGNDKVGETVCCNVAMVDEKMNIIHAPTYVDLIPV